MICLLFRTTNHFFVFYVDWHAGRSMDDPSKLYFSLIAVFGRKGRGNLQPTGPTHFRLS